MGDEEYKNIEQTKKLSYEKEKSATTYAVTKEVKQVVYAPGSVVRMSVAVAVNKILTDEEKEEIKNLVTAAAGIDPARGDVVNVSSLKFTGIDNTQELVENKLEQRQMTMEILTFIFKNVSPVIIILLLGIMALNNFGNIFKVPAKKEEQEENQDNGLPAFDPYLMLQQNQQNKDDFYRNLAEDMLGYGTADEKIYQDISGY